MKKTILASCLATAFLGALMLAAFPIHARSAAQHTLLIQPDGDRIGVGAFTANGEPQLDPARLADPTTPTAGQLVMKRDIEAYVLECTSPEVLTTCTPAHSPREVTASK